MVEKKAPAHVPAQPPEQKESKPVQQPPQYTSKEITFKLPQPTLTLKLDPLFKAKAPFLVFLFLVFAFSCLMFKNSNFKLYDMVDMGRLAVNIGKLYSLSFIIFIILFSISMALAVFYGYKINTGNSLFVFPVTLLAGIILSLVVGGLLSAFFAFSVALTIAAYSATKMNDLELGSVWRSLSRALMALTILSFLIVFMNISAHRQAYVDAFLTTTISTAGNSAYGQAKQAVQAFPLNGDVIRASITNDTVAKIVTKQGVRDALSKNPAFASLTSAQQDALVTASYGSILSDLKNQLDSNADSIAETIKTTVSNAIDQAQSQSQNNSEQSTQQLKVLVQNSPMFQSPAIQTVTGNFPIMLALTVATIVSLMNFPLRIISTAICYALGKYLMG